MFRQAYITLAQGAALKQPTPCCIIAPACRPPAVAAPRDDVQARQLAADAALGAVLAQQAAQRGQHRQLGGPGGVAMQVDRQAALGAECGGGQGAGHRVGVAAALHFNI